MRLCSKQMQMRVELHNKKILILTARQLNNIQLWTISYLPPYPRLLSYVKQINLTKDMKNMNFVLDLKALYLKNF